jgi:putative 2-oxoglutarate-Fe(II)-dependent oxygenase superfamily protein
MIFTHLSTVLLASSRLRAEPGYLERVSEWMLGHRAAHPKRNTSLSPNTYESESDLFSWDTELLRPLAKHCEDALMEVLREATSMDAAQLSELAIDLQSWFQITGRDGYQPFHIQPGGSWSGILCIDPGELNDNPAAGGEILLHDARVNANYLQDGVNNRFKDPYRLSAFELALRPGMLHIFPSYVQQECFAYFGTRPRLLLLFNCWMRHAAAAPLQEAVRSQLREFDLGEAES